MRMFSSSKTSSITVPERVSIGKLLPKFSLKVLHLIDFLPLAFLLSRNIPLAPSGEDNVSEAASGREYFGFPETVSVSLAPSDEGSTGVRGKQKPKPPSDEGGGQIII